MTRTAGEPAWRAVARGLERRILSGELGVGQALPAETALAGQLGVHRSTVREAIRVLEQNGLVRRRPGEKRLVVTAPDGQELSARISNAFILGEVTFAELWEAMLAIEPAAAAAAAERAPAALLERMEANLAATRRALDDRESLVALDIEFHALVASASGNRALRLAHAPISRLFYPSFYLVMSRLNAAARLLYAHEMILEGLQARDAAKSRAWMERHIRDFRRGYELANLDMGQAVARPD